MIKLIHNVKKWRNEGNFVGKIADLKKRILNDVSDSKAFSIGTYTVLAVVTLAMTILNIKTDKGFLTICTGAFAALCAVNILLAVIGRFAATIAKTLFSIETLCMFTFFLISGNPDGFSAIWICMLPSLGLYFFGRFRGTILCAAMFFIMAFLLWTPYGQPLLMYPYTDTFKMRFPILFIAFHMLAYLLEAMRAYAYDEMRRMQGYYQDLSRRDQLTGMLNRQGMYTALENDEKYRNASLIGVAIFDVDHFKDVNDQYGHNTGDTVLKEFSSLVKTKLDSLVCRWGGEEFVVIYCNRDVSAEMFEQVREEIARHTFSSGNQTFHITASIGVCEESEFDIKNIDVLIGKADEALYKAKSSGRNRLVYYHQI